MNLAYGIGSVTPTSAGMEQALSALGDALFSCVRCGQMVDR